MLFRVEIRGLTPLLQHRFSEEAEANGGTRRVHVERADPREEAEKVCYRLDRPVDGLPLGSLYLPATAIARMLREAGGAHKQRGSRKSLRYIVPSAILMTSDIIGLITETGDPVMGFEIDSRPVVIPATKGRIMRHRPRINNWGSVFHLDVDEQMIDPDMAHQLLIEGGSKLGVGDYRPEKGGPFGRFSVVLWQRG